MLPQGSDESVLAEEAAKPGGKNLEGLLKLELTFGRGLADAVAAQLKEAGAPEVYSIDLM